MEMVGVIPEELMACGDSPNDAEMLKLAGIGVAVALSLIHICREEIIFLSP